MAKIQPCLLGSGNETNSSHGEWLHKYYLTRFGYQTQQSTHLFTQQIATRCHEAYTIDKTAACASDQLTDLAHIDKHWMERDNADFQDGMESLSEWNYHDEGILMSSDIT